MLFTLVTLGVGVSSPSSWTLADGPVQNGLTEGVLSARIVRELARVRALLLVTGLGVLAVVV